ncbi:MAG TPA: hypothetical protein VGF99_17060 [Myxococcota bacterium]
MVSLLALLVQVPPTVVVDDATGCVAAEALRGALPALPDDSTVEVRVEVDSEDAALVVRAQVPGAAPLLRTVPRSSPCNEQVTTIARVVDRYIASVPVPRRAVESEAATDSVAALSPPSTPSTSSTLHFGAQVQGSWSTTWSRVSAVPQLRWQHDIGDDVRGRHRRRGPHRCAPAGGAR